MYHYMNLKDKYFESIKNNRKNFEVRLLDAKREKIKINDIIVFTNSLNETVSVNVISLNIYNNFEELLNDINGIYIGLSGPSNSAMLNELYSIYPQNKIANYKVLAIKFKKIG